jgi:exo-beta-1,3-glucanase (GH17 family)
MELLRLSNPKDINVNVKYGFADPFATGIACGAISMASQFINADSIIQTPDFLSMNDYIYLDATAKVNLGSMLIKYLKSLSNK